MHSVSTSGYQFSTKKLIFTNQTNAISIKYAQHSTEHLYFLTELNVL